MVSSDEPLAAGVVDALLAQGTSAVGPTRAGAEIEWNKVFARSLLAEVAPDSVPRLRVVNAPGEVGAAFEHFGETPVAVKPAGLTGGKGVKVDGPPPGRSSRRRRVRRVAAAGAKRCWSRRGNGGRVHDPGDQRRATVVFPPSTYDYPTASTAMRGRAPGGWARCRCHRQRCRS